MSSNATPTNRIVLLALGHRINAGQITHGASVGLHHHPAATLTSRIKALEGDDAAAPGTPARSGSQLVFKTAQDSTGDAYAALNALSDGEVKTWLAGYRKVIQGLHGSSANTGWESAGFPAGSTAVPRSHAARDGLLNAASAYLSLHPSHEATLPQLSGPALAITSAQAMTLHTAMQGAFALIDTRQTAQSDAKAARDGDVEALFQEVSSTIAELDDLLPADDTRWELFGLNIPANPSPPEGVSDLTLAPAGSGRLLAQWSYAVRAEYYRLFLKRLGQDDEPVNIADPKDLEYTLKDLAPGTTVEISVVPMNAAGSGPASPTVTAVVPA